MGDLTPEEMRRWKQRMGDAKVRGSPEPVPGKCGAKINRQNKVFRELDIRTPRYCTWPAGRGTTHLGYGTCKKHLGNTVTHIRGAQRKIVADDFKKTLAKRIEHADMVAEPEVVMAKLAAMAGAYLEFLTEKMKTIQNNPVSTDVSGVERSRAIAEAWERSLVLTRDTVQFMMKHGLAERMVALEEHQARTIAQAVLEILYSPRLALPEEKIDLFKEMLRFKIEGYAAQLKPTWALESGLTTKQYDYTQEET